MTPDPSTSQVHEEQTAKATASLQEASKKIAEEIGAKKAAAAKRFSTGVYRPGRKEIKIGESISREELNDFEELSLDAKRHVLARARQNAVRADTSNLSSDLRGIGRTIATLGVGGGLVSWITSQVWGQPQSEELEDLRSELDEVTEAVRSLETQVREVSQQASDTGGDLNESLERLSDQSAAMTAYLQGFSETSDLMRSHSGPSIAEWVLIAGGVSLAAIVMLVLVTMQNDVWRAQKAKIRVDEYERMLSEHEERLREERARAERRTHTN